MKKKFVQPQLSLLNVKGTNETFEPFGPALDYPGKVHCVYCNQVFNGGAAYEAHKVDDFNTSGVLIGTECPDAPKGDNRLQADMTLLS